MQQKRYFVVLSVEAHQGGLCCVGSLTVAYTNVLHGAGDGLVAETLTNQGEVDVTGDEVRGQ